MGHEPAALAALGQRLVAWFRHHARDLPWRGTCDAWRVLVSEVMLQQTQVDTVRPYYARFLERFPTVADLAAADLAEVLLLWQGLGYYRRARALHAAARQVMAAHGGVVPTDAAALRALPGIGEYTAGAVASLAGGQAVPCIDGNVNRVVARLLALPGDPRAQPGRQRVRETVLAMLPPDSPGDFNQAMMELGATLCGPRQARCGACPLAGACVAGATADPTAWPRLKATVPPRERRHVCAVVRRGDAWLFAQRPEGGRWGGLWELPRVELPMDRDPAAGLRDGLRVALGCALQVGDRLATLRHAVSGERIVLEAYAASLGQAEPQALEYAAVCWTPEPADLPLATAQRRLLAALVSAPEATRGAGVTAAERKPPAEPDHAGA